MAVAPSNILAPLVSVMKVDLVVKPDGELWLFHDQPFDAAIDWVEYDSQSKSIILVNSIGQVQELGMDIPDTMEASLLKSKTITIALIAEDKIQSQKSFVITVREI